jgi:hypothetical protein
VNYSVVVVVYRIRCIVFFFFSEMVLGNCCFLNCSIDNPKFKSRQSEENSKISRP